MSTQLLSARVPGAHAIPSGHARGYDIDTLYRGQFDFVWRSLRRLGVHEAALDDASQEVFLVAYRKIADLRPDSSPRAWLFAIAQRVASDQRRHVRRKGGHASLEPEHHSAGPTPLEDAMIRQSGDLVLRFLDTLDGDQRAAFILSELEQMTAPEIAHAQQANVNTVYYRIAAARKAFNAFVAVHDASPWENAP